MKKKKLNKEILSIDHEDDADDYPEFNEFLNETTERTKKRDASEIFDMGDSFLSEIDHKKKQKHLESEPLIDYILSNTNKYSREYLNDLDHRDIQDIHSEVEYENRSFWVKLFEFFT